MQSTHLVCLENNLARLDNIDPHRLSRSDTARNTDARHGSHIERLDAVILLPVTGEIIRREEFLLVDLAHDTEHHAGGCGSLAS